MIQTSDLTSMQVPDQATEIIQ
uniref:Uncharacterized protein n=1 Tax=Arundo donax TaxID=35708 RepID=A0A0A9HCM4_ARUDO